MSYAEIENTGFEEDIIKRKEFNWTKKWNVTNDKYTSIIPRFLLNDAIRQSSILKISSYQSFVSNFINPNTPYKRLLMQWMTGTGKTIGTLSIAMNFIKQYRMENEIGNVNIGSVFIICFSSRRAFVSELLRFPDFGFVSKEEKLRAEKLRKAATNGTSVDVAKYKDYIIKLKKRISNRKGNGFFKIYGYKEFVNRIFLTGKYNLNEMSEEKIYQALKTGEIKYNQDVLDTFKNSLIICDEIHNVYNSVEKNNWGIAIQAVLDKEPTCRAVFATATPLNNSPTEIVDLMNLLLPVDQRLTKSDFFDQQEKLKPGAIEKIGQLSRGRVSFLQEVNAQFYPSVSNDGEIIQGVPYLKFIRCKMSPLQYKTYKAVYNGYLPQDGQYLIDFVLENPAGGELGLYKANDIKNLYHADPKWKDKVGVQVDPSGIISGEFMQKETLEKYSPKYTRMLEELDKVIEAKKGKVFIYHNIVHMSGVLFVEQVLLKNGYLDESGAPTENTKCVICGKPKKEHKKIKAKMGGDTSPIDNDKFFFSESYEAVIADDKVVKEEHIINDNGDIKKYLKESDEELLTISGGDLQTIQHEFKPARFIIVHGEINKSKIDQSIEKFNMKSNAFGEELMILLGSKLIRESYDIKGIQNVFIVGRPDNIPTLIQIRGRAVRKNSHIDLPEENQHVSVKIFTSCLPDMSLSYEEQKYKEKIEAFQVIQEIEKTLHENAIDSYTNYDIIKSSLGTDPLAPLKYESKIKTTKQYSLDELNLSTFNIYYNEKEVQTIKTSIKRIFIELANVWEYNDLFNAVKTLNKYDPEINTQLFSEDNFVIAINQLLYKDNNSAYIKQQNDEQKNLDYIVERLFDPNDKIITLPDGKDSIIVEIFNKKRYFILFPLNQHNKPDIDIDIPYRIKKEEEMSVININNFVANKKIDFDYDDKKKIFFQKYQDIDIANMENVVCEYGSNFHIKFLEECIEYVFNVWTNPAVKYSDYHDFYFKMLYYYDLLSLVIWGHTVKPKFFKVYSKYMIPVKSKDIKIKVMEEYEENKEAALEEKEKRDKEKGKKKVNNAQKKSKYEEGLDPDDADELSTSGVINLLKTSLSRSSNVWIPEEFRIEYQKIVDESLKLFDGKKKKSMKQEKIKANLLPIGHYIYKFPKLYIPESGFQEEPTYIQADEDYIENDIIVGYDERSKTGVRIRFKLRAPKHKKKSHNDARLIEKGVVCSSKSKTELRELMEKLNIYHPDKSNIIDMCSVIRSKLIRLELKERIKKSKIKYFYFHYEQQK